jgi:predicted peroxiredoxin
MPQGQNRVLVILSTGREDAGAKATLAFAWACGALAMGREVMLMAIANGTVWGLKGVCDDIHLPGFEPLEQYVREFKELGGKFCICPPCLEYYCSIDEETAKRGIREEGEVCGIAVALNFASAGGQIINF